MSRLIPKRALTREQIHALSDEELAARLPECEMKLTVNLTRLSFDKTPPKKKPDGTESTGEYRRRVRASSKIDKEEFGRALRLAAESALYDSQKKQRLLDALSSTLTPERIAARKKSDAERAQRDRERDRLSDLSAVPYPKNIAEPVAEWEGQDKK